MKAILLKIQNKIDAGLLVSAALALVAAQALLQPGLPTTADLTVHLYRTLEFERAWAPGVVVPRWSPNLAYGYGYPLFIFAPPLPYLLAMALHLPGLFTIELAFKWLLIFTLLLYAVGMYLLARDLFGSVAAGLVAAVAFTFAPFALREALLAGGNVPQYLAIGLFPWPLWAASRAACTGHWRWVILAAIFWAAIVLSHLFQALVFAPMFGLYLMLLPVFHPQPPGDSRWWAGFKPLLAAPLGVLLTAFFWLPAFFERYATRAQAEIYLQKSPFFIRYPYWPELLAWLPPLDTRAANPYTPLALGVVTLALAGLGLLAGLWQSRQKPRRLATVLFFAALALAATFLTLPASRGVWETFSILQVAEFPWRMLGLANLGLAGLAGAALLLIPARWRGAAAVIVISGQLLAVAPFLYPVVGFTRFGEPTLADQINYERSSQSIGTTTLGEYLPQTVTQPPTTSPLVADYQRNQIPDRLDRAGLPPTAEAVLLAQTAVTHRYQITTPQPFTLRLFQFDFPGWRATLDDQPAAITPEAKSGLMLIDIPAGTHTLTVSFGETPVRLLALAISGLTGLGLAVAGVWASRQQRAATPPPDWPRLPLTTPTLAVLAGLLALALLVVPQLRPLFTVTSPRDQILPAPHQADVRFANGIRLAGYGISQNVVKTGGYTQIVLYWQTDAAPYRVNLQPFVHLDRLDNFTTVADATNYTPGDVTTESNLPTFHWDNLRYVRDEHDLIIPPGTPPQAYAIRVGWINPKPTRQLIPLAAGSGDTAQIGILNIAPDSTPPPLAQPLAAQFSAPNGDAIELTGFEQTALTPEQLEFTLAWRSNRRPQTDYTVFTQLLTATGELAASFDRPPLDGAYPTSTWLPGQSIVDPRFIPLDGVPPGRYRLITGLYHAATGQRLTTPGGADFVELATITVTR